MMKKMSHEKKAEVATRGAELLLKGAKMVNIACPKCSFPLYKKKDGPLYCCNCERRIVLEQNTILPSPSSSNNISPIQKKIEQLGEKLLYETDPIQIIEISKLIAELEKIQNSSITSNS